MSKIEILFRKMKFSECKETIRGPNLEKMTKSDLAWESEDDPDA